MKVRVTLFTTIVVPLIVLTIIPVGYYALSSMVRVESARKVFTGLKVEDEKEEILLQAKRAIKKLDQGLSRDRFNGMFLALILFVAFFTLWYFKVLIPVRGLQNMVRNLLEEEQPGHEHAPPGNLDELTILREDLQHLLELRAAGGKKQKVMTDLQADLEGLVHGLDRLLGGDLTHECHSRNEALDNLVGVLNQFSAKHREILAALLQPLERTSRALHSLNALTTEVCRSTEREGIELDRLDLQLSTIASSLRDEGKAFIEQYRRLKTTLLTLRQFEVLLAKVRGRQVSWSKFVEDSEDLITPQLFKIGPLEEHLGKLERQLAVLEESERMAPQQEIDSLRSIYKELFQELTREATLLKEMKKRNSAGAILVERLARIHRELDSSLGGGLAYLRRLYKGTRASFSLLLESKAALPEVFRLSKSKIDSTLGSGEEVAVLEAFCNELRHLLSSFELGAQQAQEPAAAVAVAPPADPEDDEEEDPDRRTAV